MTTCTSEAIQAFLVSLYQDRLSSLGISPDSVSRDLDLMETGVIDSLGVLEMISAIEDYFVVAIDLENLDAEQLTTIGPLSDYIANTATPSKL